MKLLVPSNINIRKEIWKGLSFPDALKVAVICATTTFLAVIYVKAFNPAAQFQATLAVVIIMAIAFIFFQRLDGISPYEIIKISLNYKKEQQTFMFKRGDTK